MWDDIINLLEEQIGYYGVMLRAVNTQNAAMRRNDIATLNECVKIEEQLMTQISRADRKLRRHIQSIRQEHKIHANLYLRTLAKRFAGEYASRVVERGDELRRLAHQLQTRTASCGRLIGKQMEFVDFNVNVMTGAVAGETYAGNGAQEGAFRRRKMFDASV